ncbi:MAG: homoserine 0-acetyltransferase protein [Rhizobium sp.]|nr:homoserine 0-acetyltransferase protein [Rhizobium sp.]
MKLFRRQYLSFAAVAAVLLAVALPAAAQTGWLDQREGDAVLKDFSFASGEVLPELKVHYITLGTAKRNAAGDVVNAVLLLHGTSGTSKNWLQPTLANELFAPGAPLDPNQYFIVIPDGIGRGGSSKPSDGLRMKFPHYRYVDMVAATHRLLTEHLGLKHLRVVLGTSMGGMQAWMWGEMHPDFMDALVPIASQPIAMSGRNWMYRRIGIEAIRNDPDWNGGNYEKNPKHYVYAAPISVLMTESAVHFQQIAPSREAMDALYLRMVEQASKLDANNQLYAIEAVMDYDPSKDLEKIKAKLLAINFADDEVNPPELGVMERGIKRIAGARFVLIPASEKTHGHYTYNLAAHWKQHLADFMNELSPPK